MIKKLFSHTLIYGIAPHLPKLVNVFVLPIITKDLSSTDFGIAGVVQAYISAFGVLQSLGCAVILANSFFKNPIRYKWLWRQVHGFLSLWSIIFSTLLGLLLFYIIPEEANDNLLPIIYLNCLPILLFSTTEVIVLRFYQLSQKPIPLAVRSVFTGVLTIIINLYTISYLKMGYMGWFWSTFLSSCISFLIFFYPIYYKYKLLPIFNFRIKTIKKALKVSLPTVPHYYSSYLLNTSDRLVMDILHVDIQKLGLYNLASTFANYFSTFGDAVGLASSPMYLQFYKRGNQGFLLARSLTFFLQTVFLLITFITCLWLKEIFSILISNSYLQNSYSIAIIIIMGFNYRPMYLGAVSLLFYNEETKRLWKISFVAGLSNVVMNFLFVPFFGIEAAAFTTFIALMYMGYSGYFIQEFKRSSSLNFYPVAWLLLTILITISVFVLKDISSVLKAYISVGIFVVLGFVFLRNKTLFKSLNG